MSLENTAPASVAGLEGTWTAGTWLPCQGVWTFQLLGKHQTELYRGATGGQDRAVCNTTTSDKVKNIHGGVGGDVERLLRDHINP